MNGNDGADVISWDSLTSVPLEAELHIIHFSFAPREEKKQQPPSPRSKEQQMSAHLFNSVSSSSQRVIGVEWVNGAKPHSSCYYNVDKGVVGCWLIVSPVEAMIIIPV